MRSQPALRWVAAARRLLTPLGKFQIGKEFLLLFELGEFGFPVLALSGVFGGKGGGLVLERNRLDAGVTAERDAPVAKRSGR